MNLGSLKAWEPFISFCESPWICSLFKYMIWPFTWSVRFWRTIMQITNSPLGELMALIISNYLLGSSKRVRKHDPWQPEEYIWKGEKRWDLALTAQMSILWTWATQDFQRQPHILWDCGRHGEGKRRKLNGRSGSHEGGKDLTPKLPGIVFPLKALIIRFSFFFPWPGKTHQVEICGSVWIPHDDWGSGTFLF